jgi:hypothetical protein
MIPWTIKGESGKAFNATVRSLADAKIDSAQISFRALEADTFTFTITPETLTSATIPELEQQVTLYRDGTQFFTGTVTSVRPIITKSSQQAQVTVSGPWWWMERVNMTSDRTDGAGDDAERMTFVFGDPTTGGNLRDHILAVIDRAIDLGVPMQKGGTIDTFFSVPQISLNQSTIGQALSELIRLVPDTMFYFDYSLTPPRINIRRRGATTTRTIDVATDPVESIDIEPMIELQVAQVRLPFVTRDVQGRTVYQEQASGTATTGKVEILTVSGPELDTFLPNEFFDSYAIKTVSPLESRAAQWLLDQQGNLVELAKDNGYSSGRFPFTLNTGEEITLYSSPPSTNTSGFSIRRLRIPSPSIVAADGTYYNPFGTTRKIIITADPPEWIKSELGIGLKQAVYEGYFAYSSFYPLPSWWESVGFELYINGYTETGTKQVIYGFKRFSVPCYITTTSYPTTTTVYRPADYSFIQPPAGLAANLKAAQDWLPYTGAITLVDEDVGAVRYRGTKINLTNTLAGLDTMGALVASESMDIATGTTTIELGQPPRLDYRTFVDRIRKTSQDNIVYL